MQMGGVPDGSSTGAGRAYNSMKQLEGLAAIVDRYDAFLVDAWGVLHDGGTAFAPAADCLARLAAAGKPVVIVSNTSRRETVMAVELVAAGIDSGHFHATVTSGELTWRALARGAAANDLGETAYFLGPDRSRTFCDGLPFGWSDEPTSADFIVNTGVPAGELDTADPLRPLLMPMAVRRLPMVCVNPDRIAIRLGRASISAGALADLYRELGATRIVQFGKPEPGIFAAALARLDGAASHRVLMIGDGFETDIIGAACARIDSLLITGGIHRGDLASAGDAAIAALAARFGATPTYHCDALRW